MSGKIKREELASELVDELDKDLKIRKISAGQAGGRLEEGPQEGGVEEHERLVHTQHDPSLRRHLQSFSAGDHLVREMEVFFEHYCNEENLAKSLLQHLHMSLLFLCHPRANWIRIFNQIIYDLQLSLSCIITS